jgi:hypothetical protein
VFGRSSGRQRAGRPITARLLNQSAGLAESGANLRGGPGLSQTNFAGVPLLRSVRSAATVRLAKVTGTLISSASLTGEVLTPGTGQITFFEQTGDDEYTLGDEIAFARHYLTAPSIAQDSIVIVLLFAGEWLVIGASCPP